MPVKTNFPVATYIKFSTSDSSLVVGDVVALEAGVSNSVIRADASDETKMPAIGIAKSVGSSSAIIQLNYSYRLPYSISISAGDEIYVDPANPGKVISTVPTTGILQKIGNAKNSNTILLSIDNFSINL